MAEEPNPDEKQYVPAYSGVPIFFAGTAENSGSKYSIWAKIVGALIVIGFALIFVWMIIGMNSA